MLPGDVQLVSSHIIPKRSMKKREGTVGLVSIAMLPGVFTGFNEVKWWGHLNNKRSIQGGNKALQLKEKCKDLVSSI